MRRLLAAIVVVSAGAALPAGARVPIVSTIEDHCAPSPAARAPDHVRVMVLDVKAANAGAGLTQIVAAEAARVRGYSILSSEEVRTALDQEAGKQVLGCDDNSCLAELAQALNAELVVGGRVDVAPDGAALVSLTLLSSRAIVVMNRVNMTWAGPAKELPDVVRAAAQMLMLEPRDRPPGSVELVGLPQDARVFVDGVERTPSDHGAVVNDLPIGPHELKVELADKLPAVLHAVVKSGARTSLPLVLEDVPVPAVWLWLGGASAVVAGGAAAVGLAYALGQSNVVVTGTVPQVGANDAESLRRTK